MKKEIKLSLLLIIIIGFQSCVIRINDDGSREVKDQSVLSNFEMKDLGKPMNYESKESIHFQVIDSKDIEKVRSENNKTWVYVWGSWCKPCIEKLPELIAIDKANEDLTLLLISEDYHIAGLQNLLFKNNYNKTPYILDTEIYGRKDMAKIEKLKDELCSECEFEGAFPQNYLYNEKENIKLYKARKLEDSELISAGIKVEE